LIHPFFDELRDPNTRLPNGRFLPPLFNFKPHGKPVILTSLALIKKPRNNSSTDMLLQCCYSGGIETELKSVPMDFLVKLIPEHARKQCAFVGW